MANPTKLGLTSGQFNRRITIQKESVSQDAVGQPVQTWTPFYSCWANITIQNSQLQSQTAEFISKVTHRITFRWTFSEVIQENMQIVYTENSTGIVHTYTIEALMNPQQANKTFVALCYEVNAEE